MPRVANVLVGRHAVAFHQRLNVHYLAFAHKLRQLGDIVGENIRRGAGYERCLQVGPVVAQLLARFALMLAFSSVNFSAQTSYAGN